MHANQLAQDMPVAGNTDAFSTRQALMQLPSMQDVVQAMESQKHLREHVRNSSSLAYS